MPPLMQFLALPLVFCVVANSGDTMMATLPLAPFDGGTRVEMIRKNKKDTAIYGTKFSKGTTK